MGKDLKYTSECKNYYIFISHATDMGNLQLPALLFSYYLTLKDAINPVVTFSSAHGCHIITQKWLLILPLSKFEIKSNFLKQVKDKRSGVQRRRTRKVSPLNLVYRLRFPMLIFDPWSYLGRWVTFISSGVLACRLIGITFFLLN